MAPPPKRQAALEEEPASPVKADAGAEVPFWKRKSLEEMTAPEWESLCDGCARCCLVKLEDEDTGMIYPTDVGCALLDGGSCRCRSYADRQEKVGDCVRLTPQTIRELSWLPPTCAYRLLAQGRDLYWWHPLVSGDPESVHAAGVSVRGRVAGPEDDFTLGEILDHVVNWPDQLPESCRPRRGKTGQRAAPTPPRTRSKRTPRARRPERS
jgi:uncharacterized cysteine cluster protein YcgN (CxxCxxCC family)